MDNGLNHERPGSVLRQEREKQKRSLSDVSKKLKLNVQYLKALEEDNYAPIPAEVFTKAYLRSYAELLGIDGEHIMELYAASAENNNAEKADHAAPPAEESPAVKRASSLLSWRLLFFAVLLAAGIVTLVLMDRSDREHSDSPTPVATDTAEQEPVAEPVEQPAAEPAGKQPVAERETEEPAAEPIAEMPDEAPELNLVIEAVELTWVSVIADEGEPREWLLRAGESLAVSATDKFSLKIGNAGGTRLILNNRDIGSLGPRGTIVDIVLPFEKSG